MKMNQIRLNAILKAMLLLAKQRDFESMSNLLTDEEKIFVVNVTIEFKTETVVSLLQGFQGMDMPMLKSESDKAFSLVCTTPLIGVMISIQHYLGKNISTDNISVEFTDVVNITGNIIEKT